MKTSGMKKWLLTSALGMVSLTSCYSGGYGYSYYAPVAPPAPRVETFGYAPAPGYVWINGYWGYRGSSYAWNPGRWERPPHAGAHWTEGRWEHHNNRWAYREGHWR